MRLVAECGSKSKQTAQRGSMGEMLKTFEKTCEAEFWTEYLQKNLTAQIVFVVNLHTMQKQSDVTHIHVVKAGSAILLKTS